MKLEDLLFYDTIIIQCHDYPDADTIASAYGIYNYLTNSGKTARIIYGGKKITKPNLLIMIERLGIPIEYAESIDYVPDLLLTADCIHGENNVTDFPAKKYAAIDHHISIRNSSNLYDIRPEYGSCSSIIAVMLKEAGLDYNSQVNLATALYYGLFTDTNGLSEISHPADRDLRDFTIFEKDIISQLTKSVLTLEELILAGNAINNVINNREYNYAVTCVEKCDPNILGYINDLVLQVDTVNVSVVCCFISGGIKISIRSCVSDIKAPELAEYITDGIGSGGGHFLKAGGFISMDKLPHLDEENVCEFLSERIQGYFRSFDEIHAEDCETDTSDMKVYVKKSQLMGYIPTTELFRAGTVFRVRSVEADFELKADENTYIVSDAYCSAYRVEKNQFDSTYADSDETFVMKSEYHPRVITKDMDTMELRFRSCRSRGGVKIYAKELKRNTKLFTRWESCNYMSGKAGDYLVVRMDDLTDIYILDRVRFEEIYEEYM